jgi:hypothetical protein
MEMAQPCTHFAWTCAVLQWGEDWKNFFPLFGALVVAATAATVAMIATWWLNTAMKRTEFFLKFTERFHNVLAEADRLNLEYRNNPPEVTDVTKKDQERRAHEVYRQFFGLMFDEFYAFHRGFLDVDVFTEWMRWRYYDANPSPQYPDYKLQIASVPYDEGWAKWIAKPAFVGHSFVSFMQEVHRTLPSRTSILRCRPTRWPFVTLRRLARDNLAIVILVSVLLVLMISSMFR